MNGNDANGLPIMLKLSEGQAHDGRSAAGASTCLPSARSLCRFRNFVERFFSKPKHFRAVATRFE